MVSRRFPATTSTEAGSPVVQAPWRAPTGELAGETIKSVFPFALSRTAVTWPWTPRAIRRRIGSCSCYSTQASLPSALFWGSFRLWRSGPGGCMLGTVRRSASPCRDQVFHRIEVPCVASGNCEYGASRREPSLETKRLGSLLLTDGLASIGITLGPRCTPLRQGSGTCTLCGLLKRLTAPSPTSHDAIPSRRAPQMPEQDHSSLLPCPRGHHAHPANKPTHSISTVRPFHPCPGNPSPIASRTRHAHSQHSRL
jgi:hypothetical protein